MEGWAVLGADSDRPTRIDLLHDDGSRETARRLRSGRSRSRTSYRVARQSPSRPAAGGPPTPGSIRRAIPASPHLRASARRSSSGPTAAPPAPPGTATRPTIQYWTTRGFAVVDVNYGGSSGYGRAFRQQLDGQWGIVDVEDCCAAATWLADTGKVDAERLVVRGGSAGGYTTLAALAFRDVFKAGASLYGIGDLKALARDTHKFESRYLDRLVGPLPEAEADL